MGANVRQGAVHICYCHTPHRLWWDRYADFQAQLPWFPRQIFIWCASSIRVWEFAAIQRVDYVVSNSSYIAKRVRKYFRRDSTVIYPPVNTSMGYLASGHDNYYLSLSRLHESKRIDLLIAACNEMGRRLVVVGTGQEERRLKAMAGPTIEFRGRVSDSELPELYANCRAFLFAADEDFGIAPVEAQSFGRPVIAYGHGGSLETVRCADSSGKSDTGVLFPEQTVEAVKAAIERFEQIEGTFSPREIQLHARRFDTTVFIDHMKTFVEEVLQSELR
jgi:glycosyltransferase involved in cell wall biosynthesis